MTYSGGIFAYSFRFTVDTFSNDACIYITVLSNWTCQSNDSKWEVPPMYRWCMYFSLAVAIHWPSEDITPKWPFRAWKHILRKQLTYYRLVRCFPHLQSYEPRVSHCSWTILHHLRDFAFICEMTLPPRPVEWTLSVMVYSLLRLVLYHRNRNAEWYVYEYVEELSRFQPQKTFAS